MHNYTDGPWTYEMISNDAARIWGPNNTFVAECWKPHGKAYPTKANARLIAAAPELLEALEHVLKHLTLEADGSYYLYDGFSEQIIKNAITKAKGE